MGFNSAFKGLVLEKYCVRISKGSGGTFGLSRMLNFLRQRRISGKDIIMYTQVRCQNYAALLYQLRVVKSKKRQLTRLAARKMVIKNALEKFPRDRPKTLWKIM